MYSDANSLNFIDPLGLKAYSCWDIVRFYAHSRVCVDDQCAGLMPSEGECSGWIKSERFDEDQCLEINLDPNKYDQEKFEGCLLKEINTVKRCTEYNLITNNCLHWTYDVIEKCGVMAEL